MKLAKRIVCIWLPMWPVDLARRKHAAPHELLLVTTRNSQQVVSACCMKSLRAGVRPGMTVAHARALLRAPTLVDADPSADRQMLERLARWSMRFSPIVGIDPAPEGAEPDGILIDITGCARVFRGEHCLAGLISAGLTGLRLHHRIGIAPTIGAAWAAAHFGDDVITFVGSEGKENAKLAKGAKGAEGTEGAENPNSSPRNSAHSANSAFSFWNPAANEPLCFLLSSFLSPLPVAALRLAPSAHTALTELGIDKVQDLTNLPRISIPSRFGPEVLHRLDQTLARAPEEIRPIRLEPPLRLDRLFEGPTTNLEAIELATRELLQLLADELSRREAGVTSLALQLDRLKQSCRGTETVEERLRLSRPCRNPRHLWSLLRPRVERVHMGFGIEGVSLIALRQRRVRHRQLSREDDGRKDGGQSQDAGELIDTLVNRLGESRVLRQITRDSHIPERVTVYEPAIESEIPLRACGGGARVCEGGGGPRPSILFENPEPIQAMAMMPDRPPTLLRWNGEDLRITTGIGPERIAEEWWRKKWQSGKVAEWQSEEDAITPTAALSLSYRDYFRVQDHSGRWLWVYRTSDSRRWFLHGVWA